MAPSNYVAVIGTPTACPGSVVSFIPVSTSFDFGTLSYQWRKNGVNIPGATGGSYTINAVTASDAGSYDVIVSNACGSDISSTATLAVHLNGSINPTSQNFAASGSNGIVNVTSSGSCAWTPTPNVSWITINSGGSGNGNAALSITDNDAVTSSSNPIDATSFFVHRQYVDFFSRVPDAPGLSFLDGQH